MAHLMGVPWMKSFTTCLPKKTKHGLIYTIIQQVWDKSIPTSPDTLASIVG